MNNNRLELLNRENVESGKRGVFYMKTCQLVFERSEDLLAGRKNVEEVAVAEKPCSEMVVYRRDASRRYDKDILPKY